MQVALPVTASRPGCRPLSGLFRLFALLVSLGTLLLVRILLIGEAIGEVHGLGCACACACAGGGRAGCTTKDFYNTDLKLRQLALKK